MGVFVGCDVGTVAAKVALVTDDPGSLDAGGPFPLRELAHVSPVLAGWKVYVLPPRRVRSDPVRAAREALDAVLASVRSGSVRACMTGSGGRLASQRLGVGHHNELRALARGVGSLYPDVDQIFEIGGGGARFLAIDAESDPGGVGVGDYELSGECAAGTGAFLDQQATRLRFRVEDVAGVALSAERAARVAGRCSVFAKTDMIHAQQKGASPGEVLRGLCEAVARNFETAVLRARRPGGRVAFVGGVAENRAVLEAFRHVLSVDGRMFTPPFPAHCAAVGAALTAREAGTDLSGRHAWTRGPTCPARVGAPAFPSWPPLDLEEVVLLRDRARVSSPPAAGPVEGFLGVDVGSVSTNLVLVDGEGELLHEIYLRTEGRPLEAVDRGLKEIRDLFGTRLVVRGSCTTGSGRELVGEFLGADAVHDEITAHKTGAFRVARRYLGTGVDTIFEIGGQDAKYIHLRDGVVVDFAMNEACAAGTGSFLEEQAEKLGVRIEGEFSRLALQAGQPLRLGERCTVFMERDVARWQHEGAGLPDLLAGLAYAVVENYLNRVVRGRPVGDTVFFQGGTAYNDAVAAAFSRVLGKRVFVPPHNGVLGAYGAALLAREKVAALGGPTSFRGFDLAAVRHEVRVLSCSGCSNRCEVQEVSIEGRKSYWGDKCSERFRRPPKVDARPVVEDLVALREQALGADDPARHLHGSPPGRDLGVSVGIPRALGAYERLPFWSAYLGRLGFRLRLSEPTTRETAELGTGAAVAEPCFPVQAAHGHAVQLLRGDVDHILVPNVVTAVPSGEGACNAFVCPWAQTFPFVLAASPPASAGRARLLAPTVRFQDGPRAVEEGLWREFRRFGPGRRAHRAAVRAAYRAQDSFRAAVERAGLRALGALEGSDQPGIVLVGRPYNLYDGGLNLHLPRKLRSLYGVNLVPLDFLPLQGIAVSDLSPNMYWDYGRRILQAARYSSRRPNLHLLYFTNFKCGPDSYVKAFAEDAAEKPFLAVQFDGHGNDAGALTRCEAYLDSIGALRWWTRRTPSTDGPSSCRGCATPAPGSSPQPCAV